MKAEGMRAITEGHHEKLDIKPMLQFAYKIMFIRASAGKSSAWDIFRNTPEGSNKVMVSAAVNELRKQGYTVEIEEQAGNSPYVIVGW